MLRTSCCSIVESALDDAAREDVVFERTEDPDEVDPVVRVEAPVFGVDYRLPHERADAVEPDGGGGCSSRRASQAPLPLE